MAGAAKKGTRPATPRPRAGAGHSRSPTIEERIVGGGGRGASEGACVTSSVAVTFSVAVAGLAKAAATRGPATAAAATQGTCCCWTAPVVSTSTSASAWPTPATAASASTPRGATPASARVGS